MVTFRSVPARWWAGVGVLLVAAGFLGLVFGVVTTVIIFRVSGDPFGDTAKAQQVMRAWELLSGTGESADLEVGAVPVGFPVGLADIPISVVGATLVGGFSLPTGTGERIVETIYWPKGDAALAVAQVREEAIALGWQRSAILLANPQGGAAAVVCTGAGTLTPAFVVSGFELDGRQVLTIKLDGTEVDACPARSP